MDGSHANKHGFSAEFCSLYIEKAYSSGLQYIEVGHGNGLGGSSLHIGRLKDPLIWDVVAEKKSKYNDLNFGVHVIPGLATFEHLELAIESGVTVFRVASHCTEADTTETYMEYISHKGFEIWGLLMMAHMIKPDLLAREAKNGKLWCFTYHLSGFCRCYDSKNGRDYFHRNTISDRCSIGISCS